MKWSSASLVTLVIFVSGCGGGGGGGTSLTTPVSITAANYQEIAASGLDTGLSAAGSTSTTGANLAQSIVGAAVGTRERVGVSKVSLEIAKLALRKLSSNPPALVAGAVTNFAESCNVSGSFSGSVSLETEGTVSRGDTVEISFDRCNDGEASVSGSARIVFSSLEGSILEAGAGTFSFTFTFVNLVVDGSIVDGSMALAMETDGLGGLVMGLEFPSLSVIEGAQRVGFSDFSLSMNRGADETIFEMSGMVYSSEFNGSITFSTPVPLVMSNDNAVITEGTMIMTGANNTNIRISAGGTTSLLVEADTNGDASYDLTSNIENSGLFDSAWRPTV